MGPSSYNLHNQEFAWHIRTISDVICKSREGTWMSVMLLSLHYVWTGLYLKWKLWYICPELSSHEKGVQIQSTFYQLGIIYHCSEYWLRFVLASTQKRSPLAFIHEVSMNRRALSVTGLELLWFSPMAWFQPVIPYEVLLLQVYFHLC